LAPKSTSLVVAIAPVFAHSPAVVKGFSNLDAPLKKPPTPPTAPPATPERTSSAPFAAPVTPCVITDPATLGAERSRGFSKRLGSPPLLGSSNETE